jgi:hypothetical protein
MSCPKVTRSRLRPSRSRLAWAASQREPRSWLGGDAGTRTHCTAAMPVVGLSASASTQPASIGAQPRSEIRVQARKAAVSVTI